MRCYCHNDREAVSTCQVCGRGLCNECADKHSPILCEDCYQAEVKRQKERKAEDIEYAYKRSKRSMIIRSVIGLAFVGLVLYWSFGEWWSFLFYFFPFGWWISEQSDTDRIVNAIDYTWLSGLISLLLKIALCAVLAVPFFIRDWIVLSRNSKAKKQLLDNSDNL